MTKINMYDIEKIRNLNEKRVWMLIPEYLQRNENICGCTMCILDIAALALNSLLPCYQVNEHSVDKAREKVSDEDIYRAIKLAADQVNASPHHD